MTWAVSAATFGSGSFVGTYPHPYSMVVCFGAGLLTTFSGLPPVTISEVTLVLLTFHVMALDAAAAVALDPRWWNMGVLLADFALVANVSNTCQRLLVGLLLLWLLVERTQATAPFGLYEASREPTGREIPSTCDCLQPPCEQSAAWAAVSYVGMGAVYLTDFYLTRGFATQMRENVRALSSAVVVASKIAALLSQYAVESAEEELRTEEAARLPPDMRDALSRLLHNLESYRPFLPDSVLLENFGPERAATGSEAPGAGDAEVCVCFTDIQGSTALWECLPHDMYEALQLHNVAVRRVAADCHAYEVKTIGDSFMFAFQRVYDACRFSLEMQQRLLYQDWPAELLRHPLCSRRYSGGALLWNGLRVRAGLHVGPVRVQLNPVTRRCDYFGGTVNLAARVEAALKHGGLVGVTEAVLAALSSDDLASLGNPVSLACAPQALRGITEPVVITLLLPPGLVERADIVREPDPWGESMTLSVSSPQLPNPLDAASFGSAAPASPLSLPPGLIRVFPSPSHEMAARSRLRLQLHQSQVTVAVVRASLTRLEHVNSEVPLLLCSVERATDASQGLVVAVLSGCIIVCWNGAKPCPGHIAQCGQFLCLLPQGAHHVGAHSASALHGNMAGTRKKHATVLGGVVEFAVALAEEAELCNDPALVGPPVAFHCRSVASMKVCRAQRWQLARRDAVVVWAVSVSDTVVGWDIELAEQSPTDTADDATHHAAFLEAVQGVGSEPTALLCRLQADSGAWAVDEMLSRYARGALRPRRYPGLWEAS